MVEWIEKNMQKIAGWLDGQEKQKDSWMDIKNVWIERKMDEQLDGWIKQIDGWLDGWMDIKTHENLMDRKIDGWLNGQKKI